MTSPIGVPYPAIPTFTDGVLVHQGDLNGLAQHATDLYTQNLGGFFTAPPLCTLRKTVGQSIPNAVSTQVLWDVADLNASGMWSAANPGVMTIAVSGSYFLYAQLSVGGTATEMAVQLQVNGLSPTLNSITTFSSQSTAGSAANIAFLAAGSIVSTSSYQKNASPATLQTTNGGCRMAAFLISN